jgi:hypothetical protein
MEDEIVKEIHETRRRTIEECGGDIERFIERLKALDAQDKDRLVTFEQVQERARSSKAKA